PAFCACRVRSIASAVLLDPVPAITGTRPAAVAMHSSTTRLCSAWVSVGDSPVVPTGTSPCEPWAICQSTNASKLSSSIEPFRIGVIRAVSDPLNMIVVLATSCLPTGCVRWLGILEERGRPHAGCGQNSTCCRQGQDGRRGRRESAAHSRESFVSHCVLPYLERIGGQ